jgi:hypothetical protein
VNCINTEGAAIARAFKLSFFAVFPDYGYVGAPRCTTKSAWDCFQGGNHSFRHPSMDSTVNYINTGGAAIARAIFTWKCVIFSNSGRVVARRDVPQT